MPRPVSSLRRSLHALAVVAGICMGCGARADAPAQHGQDPRQRTLAERAAHWVVRAREAERGGDTVLARALLEPALRAPALGATQRADLYVMRAHLFLAEAAPISARLDAERALSIDPTNGQALGLLARLVREGAEGDARAVAESARLTLKAARQGVVEAQREAGALFLDGVGIAPNVRKARYWLTRAATAGDLDAMRLLARSYGEGAAPTDRDPAQAANWAERARLASATPPSMPHSGGATGGLDETNDER